MRRALWFLGVGVLTLSAGLFAAQAGSDPDTTAAKYFAVRWSRIAYSKTDDIQNPETAPSQQATSESLTLSGEITVKDPNIVLGTLPEGIVTQLTGRRGQEIEISPAAPRPGPFYQRPQYRERFTQPPQEPRWKTAVESALRLSRDKSFRPKLVWELQPSHLNLTLETRTLDRAGGQLRSVKGYFHALVAEALENVDVPFEPNDQWVRLTPDLEIHLSEAACTASSFRFRIDTRPQYAGPMHPGDPLPARMVVDRQLLGPDGKPTQHFRNSGSWLPVSIGGSASGSGSNCQIKAIRFVIAVHPTNCQIPFEFQRVPLPDPNQPPARHQKSK